MWEIVRCPTATRHSTSLFSFSLFTTGVVALDRTQAPLADVNDDAKKITSAAAVSWFAAGVASAKAVRLAADSGPARWMVCRSAAAVM